MKNAFDMLEERGFIQQMSHEDEIRELLAKEKITLYVGIDPTSSSLHIGHIYPIMVMAHMQKMGHRPIIVVGGGTAMVGDPSGKSEMRKMLTREDIAQNKIGIKKQLEHILDFSDGKALMVDNADWLMALEYVPFLREIGSQFSVNRMLAADAFKTRMERPEGGLSFLELNYMIMQSYDFLHLYKTYDCKMQIGGDDQWSNILAGTDLIRRVERGSAYALTLPLLLTASGQKMGKTEQGAVWLDPELTSPYEFYQYWRNIDDLDVKRYMNVYTFFEIDEIEALTSEQADINEAKKTLAHFITSLIHGQEEADQAAQAAAALFEGEGDLSHVPTTEISLNHLKEGINILDLLQECQLIVSKSEGRRLIKQSGIRLNKVAVKEFERLVTDQDLQSGSLLLNKGKKVFHRVLPV
jgi:tyrosyl-tRNA synthetase